MTKITKFIRGNIVVLLVLILAFALCASSVYAKYTTTQKVADDIKITIDTTPTIDSTKLQTALKSTKSSSPASLNFVKASAVPASAEVVSSATDGVQVTGSSRIGVFMDGTNVYVAPMAADSNEPSASDDVMLAPIDCTNFLGGTSTGTDLADTLTSIDFSNLDTSRTENMSSLFYGDTKLTTVTFGSLFNTSNVSSMQSMFHNCSALESVNLSSLDTSACTNMKQMFSGCSALTSLDLSAFNTANVTSMESMFSGCKALSLITFSTNFNTANVESMKNMFSECAAITSVSLPSFNTSKVKSMSGMFSYCTAMTDLDISAFDTSSVTNMNTMFVSDKALTKITVGSGFTTSAVTTSLYMFNGCTSLVGGAGTAYDSAYADATYARIDNPTAGTPGYFTASA